MLSVPSLNIFAKSSLGSALQSALAFDAEFSLPCSTTCIGIGDRLVARPIAAIYLVAHNLVVVLEGPLSSGSGCGSPPRKGKLFNLAAGGAPEPLNLTTSNLQGQVWG